MHGCRALNTIFFSKDVGNLKLRCYNRRENRNENIKYYSSKSE